MTQLKKHRLFVYGAHYALEDTVENSLKGMWRPPRLTKSHFWYAARLDSPNLTADMLFALCMSIKQLKKIHFSLIFKLKS